MGKQQIWYHWCDCQSYTTKVQYAKSYPCMIFLLLFTRLRNRQQQCVRNQHGHAIYANTNKFLKISKTANLQAVIIPYRLSSSVFMTNNTPSGAKSIGLVQICVTLSRWFSHKTAEQCTSPSLFQRFEVTRGNSNYSLKNYGFLYDAIFFACMHAHKSLSNEI